MNCETLCLFCRNPKKTFVNLLNYHGICEKEKVPTLNYAKCIHCNSIVLFTLNVERPRPPETEEVSIIPNKTLTNILIDSEETLKVNYLKVRPRVLEGYVALRDRNFNTIPRKLERTEKGFNLEEVCKGTSLQSQLNSFEIEKVDKRLEKDKRPSKSYLYMIAGLILSIAFIIKFFLG